MVNGSLATFAYTNVIVDDEAAAKPVWQPGPGGTLDITVDGLVLNGNTANPQALIVDVDNIRMNFLNAVKIISAKIDEIVNKGNLNC